MVLLLCQEYVLSKQSLTGAAMIAIDVILKTVKLIKIKIKKKQWVPGIQKSKMQSRLLF